MTREKSRVTYHAGKEWGGGLQLWVYPYVTSLLGSVRGQLYDPVRFTPGENPGSTATECHVPGPV